MIKTQSMLKSRKEYSDIKKELDEIISKTQKLIDKDFWGYTKEYDLGLLNGSLLLIKKVKEEL